MKITAGMMWPIALALSPVPAQAAAPAPVTLLTDLLKAAGICDTLSPCVPSEENLKELGRRAALTEEWKPVPPKVTPGATPGSPPSDAVVLFDGRNLDQWISAEGGKPAAWPVHDGVVTVDKAAGGILTKQQFRDYQLHIEWQMPANISGQGQFRGNSGLFLGVTGPNDQGYEIQILDSWDNPTYSNGQAASIYKQARPLVNATLAPGSWQIYDVVWTAPRFGADGSLAQPAYVTLFHNGVLVQDHVRLQGETVFVGKPAYRAYERAPIGLQSHFDPSAPISFRNIWLRELNVGG